MTRRERRHVCYQRACYVCGVGWVCCPHCPAWRAPHTTSTDTPSPEATK